jgi:hypothetical protein
VAGRGSARHDLADLHPGASRDPGCVRPAALLGVVELSVSRTRVFA